NVTLQLSSVPPGYLTPLMDRIQQVRNINCTRNG
ncbi:ectodysplasin-A receptor-associated adapter protein, partial [Tachysurus ichikawai]